MLNPFHSFPDSGDIILMWHLMLEVAYIFTHKKWTEFPSSFKISYCRKALREVKIERQMTAVSLRNIYNMRAAIILSLKYTIGDNALKKTRERFSMMEHFGSVPIPFWWPGSRAGEMKYFYQLELLCFAWLSLLWYKSVEWTRGAQHYCVLQQWTSDMFLPFVVFLTTSAVCAMWIPKRSI